MIRNQPTWRAARLLLCVSFIKSSNKQATNVHITCALGNSEQTEYYSVLEPSTIQTEYYLVFKPSTIRECYSKSQREAIHSSTKDDACMAF